MKAIGSVLATAALLSSMGRAATARADASSADAQISAARDLFIAAEKDEDAQRWADALEKLQRVAAVKLTSGVRYHTALCEEHLGRLVAALQDYKAAASQARKEAANDVLRLGDKRVAEVNDRIPRLVVVLVSDATDVTISIDGEPAQPGTPLSLDPGTHAIEARASGRVPFSATVTLQEHDSTSVQVKLDPPPPPSPPVAEAARPEPAHELPSPAETSGTSRHVTLGLVETGAALVLVAGGIAAYAAATASHSDAVEACAQVVSDDASACDARRNAVRAWDWVAVATWAGAAGAGTLAVISFVKSRRHAHDVRDALGPGPSANVIVGPGSVGLQGAF